MELKTHGMTIVASDIDITDEEYKELANRYTRALSESMANTKLEITRTIFNGDFRDVDKPCEIEVDFNE